MSKAVNSGPNIAVLGVPPKVAFKMIGCGHTKGYQFIGDGDLETYKVGRATRITVRSIHGLVGRLLAESGSRQPTAPKAA